MLILKMIIIMMILKMNDYYNRYDADTDGYNNNDDDDNVYKTR